MFQTPKIEFGQLQPWPLRCMLLRGERLAWPSALGLGGSGALWHVTLIKVRLSSDGLLAS